ncbi:Gliding motility gldB [Constantimarinum furrinae]|uniref:Gliding motility gldB n=1 Tax=Constantimarinum furrinae TaxID=2562285 RepID=A0A7G8PRH9_9FLAO|nr:gliding motility lipoprotein GldB [Constantimarinum furrinae]QNJ96945.1 Gliding motility gldB [Constantimarinum furrinae]
MTFKKSLVTFPMKYIVLTFAVLFVVSCETKSETEKQIEAIPMDISIIRFDKIFAEASVDELPKLKSEFPVFFPEQYPDSIWRQKMQDTLQKQLEAEVLKKFPENEPLEEELEALFRHIKYYVSSFSPPQIVTTTSDVDYRNKVILANKTLVISLDNYLGSDHYFYEDIHLYISKNMKEDQIVQDVAATYAKRLISPPRQRSLLAQMIYFGKELYIKDLWLPETSDAHKIGYTEEEMQWVHDNEADMWRYFIENELLYSTDAKLPPRFINPAPFSKFYLEIDNESPGMAGRFLGWQIVKSYMENNDVTFDQLMIASTEEIFTKSKYKPKK